MIIQKQDKMNKDVFKKALGAKGDVFGAKGIIYNARGDVFKAKGDVFKAKGDVFKRADDGLTGINRMMTDTPDATQESLSDADKKGFFYYLEKTLGAADKAVDIRNKWETGISTEESGVQMDIKPGGYETPKQNNTIWYIGAIVLGVLIVVGVVYARKKK